MAPASAAPPAGPAAPLRLDHELIDVGAGRRLDRFGERLVDRPSPAVSGLERADPRAWAAADLRWERGAGGRGRWWPEGAGGTSWEISVGSFRLELRPTSSGQVGCFPEHAAGWAWLAAWSAAEVAAGRPCRILHLFGYTGGATLFKGVVDRHPRFCLMFNNVFGNSYPVRREKRRTRDRVPIAALPLSAHREFPVNDM